MKICCKCKIKKSLTEFYESKLKYLSECKECTLERRRIYRLNHKDIIKETNRRYRENNEEEIRKKKKEYSKKHSKRLALKSRKWYHNNLQKAKEVRKKYYLEHKNEIKQKCKQYYLNNKEEILLRTKQYGIKHKTEIEKYKKQYNKNHKNEINEWYIKKRQNDIDFKLACYLRSRLYNALKNNHKSGSAVRDLGFLSGDAIENVKLWLEQQFYFIPEANEWTTWENHGKLWHIDHIIPLSSFDLSDPKQLKKACHWFNLRPLWAKENLSKGKRT